MTKQKTKTEQTNVLNHDVHIQIDTIDYSVHLTYT